MVDMKYKNTVYTAKEFLEIDVALWGERLKTHHIACMNEEASYSQRKAWFDSFNILKTEIQLLNFSPDLLNKIYIIFEYELPRERGRRPDVLILSGNILLVLEFKGYSEENQSQIDQVKHYARDLRCYHEESHNFNILPVLVLAGAIDIYKCIEDVHILSGNKLHELLLKHMLADCVNVVNWFNSAYAPLPSLIQSALSLFRDKTFPQIKRAQSAKIPETINQLKNIAMQAETDKSHHLALITGVPGAGKTLVGLQFVYETDMNLKQKAVFLSGNGPLVKVLQSSLENRHFVKGVHDFLKEYSNSSKITSEEVLIYDEAQRAWDAERASSHRANSNSEPVDFMNIGSKKDFCLLVGLIGEGQEIHLGEESGLKLWSEAVNISNKQWKIHCPQLLANYFKNSEVEIVEEFNLTTSLRTHQALTLQKWVEALLENNILGAKRLSADLFCDSYPIYVTRDLAKAQSYLEEKYKTEPDKTYGIIASSRSMILPKYGIKNDFESTKSIQVAQYYTDNKDYSYCRNLKSIVTEFACQGLELDMPLLAWDADWVYSDGWVDKKPNNKAKDSFNLRKNSYRVDLQQKSVQFSKRLIFF